MKRKSRNAGGGWNQSMERFSGLMTEWTGSTTAFVAAVALIALWLVSGPIF